MADLPDFILLRAFDGAYLNLIDALTSLDYSQAVDAAPTITATLEDPQGDILNAHRKIKGKRGTKRGDYFFDRNADGQLDSIDVTLSGGPRFGRTYRLTQINVGDDTLELEFQDREVARLRRKHGHVVARRAKVTRAEFIRALIKRANKNLTFYSRELHDAQPKEENEARNKFKDSKDPGIKQGASLTVKGVKATAKQLEVAEGILTQCDEDKCSKRVMIAAIMAAIQESVLGRDMEKTGNDDTGIFQQGRNWVSAKDSKDPAKATHAFLVTGPTSWKKVHGNLQDVPGGYESAIKAVQISVGGYAQHYEEAKDIVDAFGGASFSLIFDKPYQFEVKRGESYWEAIQRLAEEVNWRAFMHNQRFYFMDDYQLLRGRPQYTLARSNPDITSMTWQLDDTQKFTDEMNIVALTDNWKAYPGDVVDVIEAGAATGRWLVKEMGGDYFSPEIAVTLYQPQRPKLEPANETEEITVGGIDATQATGKVSSLKQIAKRFSGTYVYGGGHGPALSSLSLSQGLDCSSSTSLALKLAGMWDGRSTARVSGDFNTWGKAGRGKDFTVWYNAGHVFIQGDGWRFDTSGHPNDPGPRYLNSTRSTAGFNARHW